MAELIEEYQEDRAFALKLNKRDCPLIIVKGQSEISSKEVK